MTSPNLLRMSERAKGITQPRDTEVRFVHDITEQRTTPEQAARDYNVILWIVGIAIAACVVLGLVQWWVK